MRVLTPIMPLTGTTVGLEAPTARITLARGQDRVEAVHTEHTEVGDGEVTAGVVRGAEARTASLLHQVLPLATNLVHGRCQQCPGARG